MKFIINERQEKLLIKEFMQFGFSLGTLDSIKDYNERIKYCREFLQNEIGSGLSRIVFELDDERVLKLAKDEKQIYQNEGEVKTTTRLNKEFPNLFPRIFSYAKDYSWIITERVLPFQHEDCIALLGIPYSSSFKSYEQDFKKTKQNYGEYMKQNQIGVEQNFNEDEDVDYSLIGFIDWCERTTNNFETSNEEDEVYNEMLNTIPELYPIYDYTQQLVGATDIHGDNLGLAMRNGKPTIIILDNGFDEFK